MAAPRGPAAADEWLPTGFPPRSFPPGPPLEPSAPGAAPPAGGPRRGRGWLFAAGAVVLAVVLLVAALVVANRGDDDETDLATGTSTSTSTSIVDTTFPTFEATTTAAPATLTSIDPVSTTAAGPGPSSPDSTAAPGVLEPSLSTLNLPKTDANAGASQAPLTLRNTGGTAITYTTQSSSPGLSAAPARATIAPGASATVTVTLDGARVQAEGPFTGTLGFGGTGGTRTVEVKSVVGRPPEIRDDVGESCAGAASPCSRQIKLGAATSSNPSPCNTPWLYSVQIVDQSQIQTARVIARRGLANADAQLRKGGNTNIYQSDPFTPLPAGTVLRFSVEAIDVHGFGRRLAEQTIACP